MVECSTLDQVVPGLSHIACLFVCLLICLFVCVYHGSDIITCTTSGLQILVTLCNDVRNGFSFNYMSTSKRSSTQFLNAI